MVKTAKEFEELVKDKFKVSQDIEKESKELELLKEIYRTLIDILKEWCDMREEYYSLVALWIIGTYLHDQFPTYPFLFFNAMKGSGKSRILKLITHLAKDGVVLNSLREAELFRSTGTLAIDEFEDVVRKGVENLRELLNSAYKKGTKVRRMRKTHTKEGDQQVVEEFEVYRPIVMANINGMDNVLDDRCVKIVLEKSEKRCIVNLMEIFDLDPKIIKIKELMREWCSVCSVELPTGIYISWNKFVMSDYSNSIYTYIHTIHSNHSIHTLFKKLKNTNINGRELELSFPLLLISMMVEEVDNTLTSLTEIMKRRRDEHNIENWDISLYDFVSQEVPDEYYHSVAELTRKFAEFLNISSSTDLNTQWMGLALKRLNLVLDKKRKNRGVEVRLDYLKAQEKIKIFK